MCSLTLTFRHSFRCFCILASLMISAFNVYANDFPAGFAAMEIEAKWDADATTFATIVAAFPHNGTKYGYDLEVRWNGRPRRYVDRYFDSADLDLFGAQHVFRHRQRSQTTTSVTSGDSFAVLGSTNWDLLNWQKVQYKSTPTRLAAVWFRTEQGGEEVNNSQVNSALGGVAPRPPYTAADDPIALLLGDHPGFDFSNREEVLVVTQYRYRVEFKDPVTGVALYELSMDKIVTARPGQAEETSFGVELEILPDVGITQGGVERLFELMQLMENEFILTRATTGKGDTVVEDSAFPIMRLDDPLLNFKQVETGFAFTKPLVIYNDGYARLDVSLEFQPNADLAHWPTAAPISNLEVDIGDSPLIVEQVYEPQDVGVHSVLLTVATNDPNVSMQTVTLMGVGTSPTPIDSVLVLDRSGSMDDPAGERQKIQVMRDAADLYIHLLRPALGNSGESDSIGFVKYNDSNSVYLPLDSVDDPSVAGSHMATAENQLSDSALTDANRLLPDDATGIGGAMNTAAGMFAPPSSDRRHVMVVLTDGIENRSPFIGDVIGPIQANDSSLSLYSVGLGDDYEADKLQSITNVGDGGYHQVSADLSGLSIFDLENFYFKIFSHATDMDLNVDPTFFVPVSGADPVIVDSARVTSSDRQAVFLLLESPVLREFYTLELIAPTGQVVKKDLLIAGRKVEHVQRHTYTVYKVALPDPRKTKEYLGDWKVQLTPKGNWDPRALNRLVDQKNSFVGLLDLNPKAGLVPIGFSSAVKSNYRMSVAANASNYKPGSEIRLVAQLTDRGVPVVSARVSVVVDIPRSGKLAMQLYDDGTHGDAIARDGSWTNIFQKTDANGTYRFLFRSQGRNAAGEMVAREADRYVSLIRSPREPVDCKKGGKGC